MADSRKSRLATLRTQLPGARRCPVLLVLSALLLIGAVVATPTASAARSVRPGGDPLALIAIQQAELTASDAVTGGSFGLSVAVSGDTVVAGAYNKTVNGLSGAGVTYVDVLKAAPLRVQVGKQLTLSGAVKHFLTTAKTVRIKREVGSKLIALQSLALTKSGAFKWVTKPQKAGIWVFVVAYKVGKVTYLSKPVTVKVYR